MAIACTMVDHDSPLGPGASLEGSTLSAARLASLHRELASYTKGWDYCAYEAKPGRKVGVHPPHFTEHLKAWIEARGPVIERKPLANPPVVEEPVAEEAPAEVAAEAAPEAAAEEAPAAEAAAEEAPAAAEEPAAEEAPAAEAVADAVVERERAAVAQVALEDCPQAHRTIVTVRPGNQAETWVTRNWKWRALISAAAMPCV